MAKESKFLKLYLPDRSDNYDVERDQNENFLKLDGALEHQDKLWADTVKKLGDKYDKTGGLIKNEAVARVLFESDYGSAGVGLLEAGSDTVYLGNYSNGVNTLRLPSDGSIDHNGFQVWTKENFDPIKKQDKTDTDLVTSKKTIVGAINENASVIKKNWAENVASFEEKQDKTDDNLETIDRTVIGAVNELRNTIIGNTGIEFDGEIIYIQENGTKQKGKAYLDKLQNGLYECLSNTTTTVNSNVYFKNISNFNNRKKIDSLKLKQVEVQIIDFGYYYAGDKITPVEPIRFNDDVIVYMGGQGTYTSSYCKVRNVPGRDQFVLTGVSNKNTFTISVEKDGTLLYKGGTDVLRSIFRLDTSIEGVD